MLHRRRNYNIEMNTGNAGCKMWNLLELLQGGVQSQVFLNTTMRFVCKEGSYLANQTRVNFVQGCGHYCHLMFLNRMQVAH